jgi:hypothetical protein
MGDSAGSPTEEAAPLTPAQQYAGEILAHLLKVVLGRAGDPRLNEKWATRGLDEDLDFETIQDVMKDTKKNQLRMMVLDTNILPLAKVLYYYDSRLSLHKGQFELVSVFPAPEFVAIRLLLLQKIHRGEKISLDRLMAHKELLFSGGPEPTGKDLDALKLRPQEVRLMRDIIASEPHMFQYLTSPFLVRALHEVGVLESDRYAARAMRYSNYRPYSSRYLAGSKKRDALKIVILPSMTKEFFYGKNRPLLSPEGFWPTPWFSDAVQKLAVRILAAAERRVKMEIEQLRRGRQPITGDSWDKLWEHIVHEKIAFFVEDDRPLVITPKNVEQVIRDVSEDADIVVVLMGKNVYLAVAFDEGQTFPRCDRLYLDILDVTYDQFQWEADQLGGYIASRLASALPDFLP